MKLYITILLMIFTCSLTAEEVRGIYVDQFDHILGDPAAEEELLTFAQENKINYLALYDLHKIHKKYDLQSAGKSKVLADFMQKAKDEYEIREIGAVGENINFFKIISHFNELYPGQQFEVFNFEFEYWNPVMVNKGEYYDKYYLTPNNLSPGTKGAFEFYINELQAINSLAEKTGKITEVYLGKPQGDEAQQIAALSDRILLHVYQPSPERCYAYAEDRLKQFAEIEETVIIPIFSGEDEFCGPWLQKNNLKEAYTIYLKDYQENFLNVSSNTIQSGGYHWFTYSFLRKKDKNGST